MDIARTPKGYVSRKAIGTQVILVTGATVTITDVLGKWVHFSDGTRGHIGHIMALANPLRCDMRKTCKEPVTDIDYKGFCYCSKHGAERMASVPCRKLTSPELQTLRAGKPLRVY